MDELIKLIEDEWRLFMKFDPTIKSLVDTVNAGTATYAQAHSYAIRVGEILHGSVMAHLNELADAEGIIAADSFEALLKPLLNDDAAEIANICESIQNSINEAAQISLKAKRAAAPVSRIEGIAKAAATDSATLQENMIQLGQSVVDDSIKTNAKFLDDVGLKGVIIRETEPYAEGVEERPTGGRKKPRHYSMPCKWCQSLAGQYAYGTEPNDVYRRHSGCRCTTDYAVGKTRQDVWSKVTRNV